MLEASAPDGLLIGLDRDKEAIEAARLILAPYGERVKLVGRNFGELADVLAGLEIASIDGLLLDVGVSSHQLDTKERGFSFQHDAPLDMRMDTSSGETAADLVNRLSESELTAVIKEFGEGRWARRIAIFITQAREKAPIVTTLQLVEIIKQAIPRGAWEDRLHPATRTFQALRIAVNDELENLERGLAAGVKLLKKGGRIAVISFHSLEDRIVKNALRAHAQGCTCPKMIPRCVCGRLPEVKVLTSKPVTAAEDEVKANPRARSAKLRCAEKL